MITKFKLLLCIPFFLVACDFPLSTTYSNGIDYRALVKPDASFIGKGIKVATADPKWDWYLPDLNSSAQVMSKNYELPADNNGAKYLRSFSLYDYFGFVWGWQNKGVEILLIYTFTEKNGYFLRTLHNVNNITVDEAILAIFFDDEYAGHLESFQVEKWIIANADNDHIGIESLGFLGDQLESPSEHFTFFEDRVMTLPKLYLKKENTSYSACSQSSYFNSKPCYHLPTDFISRLENTKSTIQSSNIEDLCVQLKVTLSTDRKIKQVLAGMIFECDFEIRPEVYERWSIPVNYLGAGINKGLISYDEEL